MTMAGSLARTLSRGLLRSTTAKSSNVRMMTNLSGVGTPILTDNNTAHLPIQCDIGKREVVGYGMHGEEMYFDSFNAPFPAIRFKEDTAEISRLREKEKGDWKKLTLEEKKALYRSSFCLTLAEMDAPTGEWKSITGLTFFGIGMALWFFMWMKYFVYEPLPDTCTDETKLKAQIDRMVAIRVNPIQGFTSNYDYEKGEWKK